MENWATALDTLRGPEPFFFSTITPLEWKIPMVAVEDIGAALASETLKQAASPKKPYVFELHGPRMYNALDVQLAFSDAMGKQVGLKPVEKKDLHGFFQQVFPEDAVPEWVEMAMSFLPGGVMKPGELEEGTKMVSGKIELGDALKMVVQPIL